jgi:hypothetical protein
VSRRLREQPAAFQVTATLLGFAVAGALCGVLWEWLWNPAQGVVVKHVWYPVSWDRAQPADFSGTGWYVAIGLVVGLLLGALAAWRLDRWPIGTLVAVVVGGLVAAYLMRDIGYQLSPQDPALLAQDAADGTQLPSDLTLTSWYLLGAFPGAGLAGLALVFLLVGGRSRFDEAQAAVESEAVSERSEPSPPA